ncbi:hypothetical protein M9H77_16195 [Catharanthus roseus]|uniref:Uncharacterized protein n=1 Tax=Catharanthus roseus TaxID=4058 RepID=A0ACC0AZ75_CATRO|nr:hypothetical protein M9H77_16195 [Catharanthus roseus]
MDRSLLRTVGLDLPNMVGCILSCGSSKIVGKRVGSTHFPFKISFPLPILCNFPQFISLKSITPHIFLFSSFLSVFTILLTAFYSGDHSPLPTTTTTPIGERRAMDGQLQIIKFTTFNNCSYGWDEAQKIWIPLSKEDRLRERNIVGFGKIKKTTKASIGASSSQPADERKMRATFEQFCLTQDIYGAKLEEIVKYIRPYVDMLAYQSAAIDCQEVMLAQLCNQFLPDQGSNGGGVAQTLVCDKEKTKKKNGYLNISSIIPQKSLELLSQPFNNFRFKDEELGVNIGNKNPLNSSSISCSFNDLKDKEEILYNSPWSFKKTHIIMKDFPPHLSHEEIDFSISQSWVQVYNLPPDKISLGNAKSIGNCLGKFKE